jgi:hypothetical protein
MTDSHVETFKNYGIKRMEDMKVGETVKRCWLVHWIINTTRATGCRFVAKTKLSPSLSVTS